MSAPATTPSLLPPPLPRLVSYADVLYALTNGHAVRFVIRYAKCILTVQRKRVSAVPDSIGDLEIKTWEQIGSRNGVGSRHHKAYLTTSQTSLITHRRHGTVLHYLRLRLNEDDSVLITARYLRPDTYEIVMEEAAEGRLSDSGNDEQGISCFLAD